MRNAGTWYQVPAFLHVHIIEFTGRGIWAERAQYEKVQRGGERVWY